MENSLAPIALFVYNRLFHTKKTIEALQKNKFANESELFIYSDGSKNDISKKKVSEVRNYIKTIQGFKKITIVERDNNWGLADSIIDGVSRVVSKYEKVIVLEDDIVTSPYFLNFMNSALNFYKREKKVWHISGWNYPIAKENFEDVFLWRVMNCWGWATWADRWQYYDKNVDTLIKQFNKEGIKKFNLDGVENFWGQVISNKQGKINTWAIFWYATIFKKEGFCLNPIHTFVENIGHDGSGVHCGDQDVFSISLSKNEKSTFTNSIQENKFVVKKIKEFYTGQKKHLIIRIINKGLRPFFKRNIIK